MGRISKDIHAEEQDTIKDHLWKLHQKKIKKGATRGFVDWYKSLLLKESLEAAEKDSSEDVSE